jgi:hypothetical protein
LKASRTTEEIVATSLISQLRQLGEPQLPMFNFSLPSLLNKVRGEFPELLSKRVMVWLCIQPTLATVELNDNEIVISIHAVLNHAQTPEQVIGFILRHELLHMIIPPREVNGVVVSHPPEFWTVERDFPDRVPVWNWLTVLLGPCMRSNKKQQRTLITREWKKRMHGRRLSLNQFMDIVTPAGRKRNIEKESLF